MACPTPVTPYTPSGWGPSSTSTWNYGGQGSGIAQIIPPTNIVPSGSAVCFIQLSVESSAVNDAVFPCTSSGAQAGNPVRSQVSGIYNEALGWAPLFGGAFYLQNVTPSHTFNVWVVVLGYA